MDLQAEALMECVLATQIVVQFVKARVSPVEIAKASVEDAFAQRLVINKPNSMTLLQVGPINWVPKRN